MQDKPRPAYLLPANFHERGHQRLCPACGQKLVGTQIVCRRDWRKLPEKLRRAMLRATGYKGRKDAAAAILGYVRNA